MKKIFIISIRKNLIIKKKFLFTKYFKKPYPIEKLKAQKKKLI